MDLSGRVEVLWWFTLAKRSNMLSHPATVPSPPPRSLQDSAGPPLIKRHSAGFPARSWSTWDARPLDKVAPRER